VAGWPWQEAPLQLATSAARACVQENSGPRAAMRPRQSVALNGAIHARACFNLSSCLVLRVIHSISGSRAMT
jgi:hypothetical protein